MVVVMPARRFSLSLFSGRGLEAYSELGATSGPQGAQIGLEDGVAAFITHGANLLQ